MLETGQVKKSALCYLDCMLLRCSEYLDGSTTVRDQLCRKHECFF